MCWVDVNSVACVKGTQKPAVKGSIHLGRGRGVQERKPCLHKKGLGTPCRKKRVYNRFLKNGEPRLRKEKKTSEVRKLSQRRLWGS